MKISGFNKLTLLDYPKKMAAIIFTAGCNYKCGYCQNSSLIKEAEENFSESEILNYLDGRKKLLDGVVISGGEPTIQKDLVSFIKKIKEIGLLVKLDTNGTNPLIIKELIDHRLIDYIAMDVKMSFDKYEIVTGVKANNNILESIDIIKNSKIEHEFRTTIIKNYHTFDDIYKIANFIGKDENYYLQNFEMSEGVLDKSLMWFSKDELKEFQNKLKVEFPNLRVRGI